MRLSQWNGKRGNRWCLKNTEVSYAAIAEAYLKDKNTDNENTGDGTSRTLTVLEVLKTVLDDPVF